VKSSVLDFESVGLAYSNNHTEDSYVKSNVLTAMAMKIIVFSLLYSEDGARIFFRNVDDCPPNYTAQYP
jgi:hypothetical protein